MNILIVNHFAYAPDQSAGTRHYEISKELIKRGHRPLVVASSFYHKTRKESRLEKGEAYRIDVVEGVPYLWVRTPSYKNNVFRRTWNMISFARRLRHITKLLDSYQFYPDIIIGSTPSLFAANGAMKLARRLGKPFIVEVRDLWPDSLMELGGYSSLNPMMSYMRLIERKLYRKSDKVVTVLPNSIKYISRAGVSTDKISWIPNGINLDNIPFSRPRLESETGFVIKYAGAHGLYNGLDTVLDAARLLQDRGFTEERVKIEMIGDGPHKTKLVEKAKNLDLRLLYFKDSVPKSKIYEELKSADAFLMILKRSPVFKYGISANKLWDYMAMGKPVIFSVDCIPDPVQQANAGISVAPDDAKSLADAICKMEALSFEEKIKMGERGHSFVERHHNIKTLTEKYVECMRDCIS